MSLSQSPSPSDPDECHIPDDATVMQFPNLDPAEVLDNPSLLFGKTRKKILDTPLDEKTSEQLLELTKLYEKLAFSSFSISQEILKHRLAVGDLTHKDIYYILDKFYNDYPTIFTIPGFFLTSETLPLFQDKQSLHVECAKKLKNMGKNMARILELSDSEEDEEEDDYDGESSDDEIYTKKVQKKNGKSHTKAEEKKKRKPKQKKDQTKD